MRALFLTSTVFPDGNFQFLHTSVRAALSSLGISYRRASVEALPGAATINAFDFVIIPGVNNGTAFVSFINNANYTVPVFVMDVTSGMAASNLGATPGISDVITSLSDNFITTSWSTTDWLAANTKVQTISTGTSLVTVSAISPLTGSAQANAGKTAMWKTPRASGASTMYVNVISHPLHPVFPLMLQYAINDNVFTDEQVATLRRIPVTIDLDHINQTYFRDDLAAFEKFMSYVPAGGTVWAGIYNSTDSEISGLSGAFLARLQAEQDKRLKYCYHNHSATRQGATSGTWPYAAQGGTLADVANKTDQDTNYATDKGLWEAAGLAFADAPLYYNNGSFRFNDDTLALFSPDKSLASSPGNDVSKYGYGYTVFRANRASSRSTPQLNTLHTNCRAIKQTNRGIMLVPVNGVGTGDAPLNTIAKWRDHFKYLTHALSYESSYLIHPFTFQTPQDPDGAGGYAGETLMQQITDMRLFMSDCCDYFADPTQHWLPRKVVM